MKKFVKRIKDKRAERKAAKNPQTPKEVPNISNATVAEHRDEVLSSARKYIYPLQHSKHKIVIISTTLFIVTLVALLSYCTIGLYKLHSNSSFLYRVTQVIPFPVARIGGQFVAYENYLFELRRYTHYYETQQKLDFQNNELDKQQLDEFRKRALEKVIDFAYVKQIAKEKNITVSSAEVEEKIQLLRDQNRLGSAEQIFEDVLKDYFGWSRKDFERYLNQEILTQKVIAANDPETQTRADQALAELKGGKDFDEVAKKYSDDVTSKNEGGEFGFTIDKNNRDLTPEATSALFKLKAGEHSEVINTGYSLEIFKMIDLKDGGKAQAAHILFNFKEVDGKINDMKSTQAARAYVSF